MSMPAIVLLSLFAVAAGEVTGSLPPDVADCIANFRLADVDADGTLSATEISAARGNIPDVLAAKPRITDREFASACEDNASAEPGGGEQPE